MNQYPNQQQQEGFNRQPQQGFYRRQPQQQYYGQQDVHPFQQQQQQPMYGQQEFAGQPMQHQQQPIGIPQQPIYGQQGFEYGQQQQFQQPQQQQFQQPRYMGQPMQQQPVGSQGNTLGSLERVGQNVVGGMARQPGTGGIPVVQQPSLSSLGQQFGTYLGEQLKK